MIDDAIEYVRKYLLSHNGDKSRREQETFRHRSEHVLNVYKWARRIVEKLDDKSISTDSLYLACIFHDVGYGSEHFHNSHPIEGADIWKDYAIQKNYDRELIDYVYYLIRMHSNKELLNNDSTPIELVILLEADLLDEEGAMSICWDLMTLGCTNPSSYQEALTKIKKFSAHILANNPLKTIPGREFWSNKQLLVKTFISSLEFDLFDN